MSATTPPPKHWPGKNRAPLGDLIRGAGKAIWGEQWINPMGRALGMSPRSMRRIIFDEPNLSPEYAQRIRDDVMEIMHNKVKTIMSEIEKGPSRG